MADVMEQMVDIRLTVRRAAAQAPDLEWWWTVLAEARVTSMGGELTFQATSSRGDLQMAVAAAQAEIREMTTAWDAGLA